MNLGMETETLEFKKSTSEIKEAIQSIPNGLDPEDYIDRIERPVRRNPQIARLLYYSKDIESFGTGLRRIAQYCKMSGVRYEFQKKKTGFVVCFYRNKMSTVREAYGELEDGDKKPINPEKADKKSSGLFEK